jgi:biopolymer transport protein ExbD
MAKFKKDGGKETPAISTASLPDIIFMLLFFFMVATVMREVQLIVTVKAPQATEIQKLEDKSLVSYIYIGKPVPMLQATMGIEDRIQLNDAFANADEIKGFIMTEITKLKEKDRKKIIVGLKVDSEAKMGLVSDVKQELRKANALKINYSTRRGSDTDMQKN